MPGTQKTFKGRPARPPVLPAWRGAGCRNGLLPAGTRPRCLPADVRVDKFTRRLSAHTEGVCGHLTGPGFSYQKQQPSPSVPGGDIKPQGRPSPPQPVLLDIPLHGRRGGAGTGFLQAGLCWAITAQPSFWGSQSRCRRPRPSVLSTQCGVLMLPEERWRIRGAQDRCGVLSSLCAWRTLPSFLCPGAVTTKATGAKSRCKPSWH